MVGALPSIAASSNRGSGAATLLLDLPRSGIVRVGVYDLLGRLVRSLRSETLSSGRHRILWDGKDAYGRPVLGGMYFLRVLEHGGEASGSLTIIR